MMMMNHGYYQKQYLKTTVDKTLETTATRVEEDFNFFLSLLKNNTGKYNKEDDYNPNGKEVVYKTVYDSEDRVGRFFTTSAEMFFNLLQSSPHTEGLLPVMKYKNLQGILMY